MHVVVDAMKEVKDIEGSTAAYCLSLPGKTVFLTHLLSLKKFWRSGNKDGALRAIYKLEEEGLGKLLEVAGSKGSQCVSSCTMQMKSTKVQTLGAVQNMFEVCSNQLQKG